MTLPSSKLKRVVFEDPDVTAQRPHKHATLQQASSYGGDVIASDRGIQGQYHQSKRDDAHRLALAIMATNKHKAETARERPWKYDQKRVGETVFGRSEGIYNATKNIWIDTPPNVYEETYGGVLSTTAGQTFKAKKLAQRIVNLNARDNVTAPLGATVPTGSKVSNVTFTPPPSLVSLETALNDLQSNVISGNFTAETVSLGNRFYASLVNTGPKMDLAPLDTIRQALEALLQRLGYVMTIDSNDSSRGGLSADRFRVAQNVLLVVLRCRDVVLGLIKTVDFSESERKLAMGSVVTSARKYDPSTPSGRSAALAYYMGEYPQYFSGNMPNEMADPTSGGTLARLVGGCDCEDEVPKKKRF